MTLEALCDDDKFCDRLLVLSRKNLIPFDDFRQDVLLYVAEYPKADTDKAAMRIAKRMRRQQIRGAAVSLDALGAIGDDRLDEPPASLLWEDRHFLTA